MSPKKSTPSPTGHGASTTKTEETPSSGGLYEVGVELQDVGPAAQTGRARADRCTRQPPRSACFLVENCKWCRPDANSQSDRGTLPAQEETPAVKALRECLATPDRDTGGAEVRRASCLDLVIERYIARRRVSA